MNDLTEDATHDLINELVKIVSTSHSSALPRMRLAISPQEYLAIEKYMRG